MTSTSVVGVIRRATTEAPILTRRLWLILLLNMGGTSVQLLIPVLVQQSVDRFISGPGSVEIGSVMTAAAIGLVVIVTGGLLARGGIVRLSRQAGAGLSELRVKTFAHLMRRSVLHVEAERRGALVSRVTSDINTVQDFLEWGGVMFLINGTQVVASIVMMTIYEWRLALLVIVGVLMYAIVLLWFQRVLSRKYDIVRNKVADSLAAMGEAVTALPEVRAYGAEEATMNKVQAVLDDRFTVEFRTARFSNMLFATAEIFAAGLTAAVIAAGLWLGPDQGITAGVLLAFLFLVNLLVEPVQTMVEILDFAQSAAAGMRRVVEALDGPVDIPEATDPVELPSGPLGVDFAGVRYRYPTGPDVLVDIDCRIEPGGRVAVVGETGSGKTTFSKILVRMLDPVEGHVEVGGVDLRRVSQASLRSRVAFVPQEGFLFDGSVADNIRYGKPEATDAEIATAFLELGLDGWVESLTDGIASRVGVRGSELSAGERQLVALVRAWISIPDLLVLDEATSAVDPALDVQLRRAIDRLTAGRTSVTIAHRLATAEAADEVLVFDAGRLAERGTHRQLLETGGVYAHLYTDWTAGTKTV